MSVHVFDSQAVIGMVFDGQRVINKDPEFVVKGYKGSAFRDVMSSSIRITNDTEELVTYRVKSRHKRKNRE